MKSNRSKNRRSMLSIERLENREMLAVDVDVMPFDHQQEFIGGGAGFTLYSGHLVNGITASQRETVYDWLFEDLNLPELRIFSFRGEAAGNDNNDPFDLDLAAMDIPTRDNEYTIYQEAIERNPNTRVMAYANSVPPHIADADGNHDLNAPNFHEEHAEWLYANLVITKQRYGVDIEMLDILNEPDNGKLSRTESAAVISGTVPALQSLVDANFATYGITMPLITGPSNLTIQAANNWLTDWDANDPATWNSIDILAGHPYGGGGSGFNQSNYESIASLKDADHPLFIQNEFEFGHSSFVNNDNALPEDLADDDLEAALAQARIFAMAMEGGADGFHVFQGVNPSSRGGSSLIRTPWGQDAVRRTGYYTYKQLSSLQPEGSDVVTDTTTGAPEGFHTLAYNKWGDNRVFVNIVNATSTESETTNLTFHDNDGSLIPILKVTDYVTDANNNLGTLSEEAFSSPTTSWSTTVEPLSVRTFVVELAATGYAVPVGDLTYLRERNGSNFNSAPQDGDVSPRPEFLVGHNGNGAAGIGFGIMRAIMEFDVAAVGIPAADAITTAQLELRSYRGDVDPGETATFDLYELDHDFVEATATWLDPDGDGDENTGVTTPGGVLGTMLSSSSTYDGNTADYDANGSTEIFHERVVLGDTNSFGRQVTIARNGDFRVALTPNLAGTTGADFLGFFDEDTDYAPELIVTAVQTDLTGPSVSSAEFRHETDKRIAYTFSEEIDTSTLSSSDFQVTNLTTGAVLSGNSVILSNVTPTSAELIVRSSLFDDGDWQVVLTGGSMQDLAGIGNFEHTLEFFKLDGDANRDRAVDSADYTLWRDTLGSTSDLRANADNSGLSANVIDQADYNAWASNYGKSLPALPAAVAAPEAIENVVIEEEPLVEQAVAQPLVAPVESELQPVEATETQTEVLGFVPITVQVSLGRNTESANLDENQSDDTASQQAAENLLLSVQEAFAVDIEEIEIDLFGTKESDAEGVHAEATDELLASLEL